MRAEDTDVTKLEGYEYGKDAGIAEERARWLDALTHGCGDNSCVVRKPRGMATNGGCQCCKVLSSEQRRAFLHALNDLRAEVAKLAMDGERARWAAKVERLRKWIDGNGPRGWQSGLSDALAIMTSEDVP